MADCKPVPCEGGFWEATPGPSPADARCTVCKGLAIHHEHRNVPRHSLSFVVLAETRHYASVECFLEGVSIHNSRLILERCEELRACGLRLLHVSIDGRIAICEKTEASGG